MEATVQETETESRYLTYNEAARYVHLDKTTIWRATKSGALKACGPGRAVRFAKSDLDAWMRSRTR
jgi:excisionase family DNA binding protein